MEPNPERKAAEAAVFAREIAQGRAAGRTSGQVATQQATAPQPLEGKALDLLDALIFRSSSGGQTHIVTVHTDQHGGRYVRCTCKAMLSIERYPSGCWAMQAARSILGIPPVAQQ